VTNKDATPNVDSGGLMPKKKVFFLRYPGGKSRMLDFLIPQLTPPLHTAKRFVEPFAGGGAVFFALCPKRALLSDINPELIDLYGGIRRYPIEVWNIFQGFPPTKDAYYKIRDWKHDELDLQTRTARTLYLNRTCFKGMWRHNGNGEFNVGYGGQGRRWVISEETLVWISKRLRRTSLKCSDFEEVIDACEEDDFIFLDPPYRPGALEMIHDHYRYGKFSFEDHKRLAATLKKASARGVLWAMTTSSHPDIAQLYRRHHIVPIPRGTGRKIGVITKNSGEVLVHNYEETSQ
jgi:DNA adenine methylase